MSMQRYPSPTGLPLSRMIKAGGFVFFSGQIPVDAAGQVVRGSLPDQTRAVMDRLAESLAEVGLGFDDVVKATVWLSDMGQFADFNQVYKEYFKNGVPVRSTVQARLALDVDIEIEIMALER